MTPEEAESLVKSQRPENASMERPAHVKGQPPKKIYPEYPNTKTNQAKLKEPARAITPR